jgi:hypothetical protein
MNDLTLQFDFDALTLGDFEDFEDYAGTKMTRALGLIEEGKVDELSGREIVALLWVVKRHSDPTFTVDQARALKVTSLALEVSSAVAASS